MSLKANRFMLLFFNIIIRCHVCIENVPLYETNHIARIDIVAAVPCLQH